MPNLPSAGRLASIAEDSLFLVLRALSPEERILCGAVSRRLHALVQHSRAWFGTTLDVLKYMPSYSFGDEPAALKLAHLVRAVPAAVHAASLVVHADQLLPSSTGQALAAAATVTHLELMIPGGHSSAAAVDAAVELLQQLPLHSLTLTGAHLAASQWARLSRGRLTTTLRHLDLRGFRRRPPDGLAVFLTSLASPLETLALRVPKYGGDGELITVAELSALKRHRCPELALTLSPTESAAPEPLEELAAALPALAHLQVAQLTLFRFPPPPAGLIHHLCTLQSLHLENPGAAVDDAALAALAVLPRLRDLGASNVTASAAGFAALAALPIEMLWLTNSHPAAGWAAGLADWQCLRFVYMGKSVVLLGADWNTLMKLPPLRSLHRAVDDMGTTMSHTWKRAAAGARWVLDTV